MEPHCGFVGALLYMVRLRRRVRERWMKDLEEIGGEARDDASCEKRARSPSTSASSVVTTGASSSSGASREYPAPSRHVSFTSAVRPSLAEAVAARRGSCGQRPQAKRGKGGCMSSGFT